MANFITTDEVKILLKITDTSQDDLIETLLPMVQNEVEIYCNRTDFLNAMKPTCALMINYRLSAYRDTGLKSENIGSYSYSKDMASNGYPDNIISGLNRFRILSAKLGTKQTKYRDKRGQQATEQDQEIYAQSGLTLEEED